MLRHFYSMVAAFRPTVLQEVLELDAVVLYDPGIPDGFYLVPRLRVDDDLVRPPA